MFEDVLRSLASGEITIQEAEEKILSKFFERTNELMLDMERDKRQGFPEIVFALGKTKEQTIAAVEKFLERKGIAFVSGLDEEKKRELKDRFSDYVIKEAGRLVVLKRENTTLEKLNGKVGVITAGTSDVPFAEETSLILEELGVSVQKVYDAGVAGIHRSFYALSKTKDSDLLIVFAGMEGILPSLIASLTDLPVIAVPTPVGYGFGGEGLGALSTMLQTCVPGLVVVNIGNTVGAAAAAVRILRRIRKDGQASENKRSY
ncbi:nickel pincer cofactor biosynthesis protein LarB [Thermotoga sp. RQ2]|uniref:nickel pincer cofactor biosynthesis protein LarB n=1 Tax=Thermotoga sp. (strain RQ2) TaxID=126740 RepID=UPI00016017D4|nr:nickel pincer cofactor biosynthesis protein LarB [Thermotoga sp. RQ2]ACB10153.1 1-(5-phosphoribosyl)-5-amino-4-imidazole-carboxylate (AIR) carboxylase [Thermotoga sp. RQ2]